MNVGDAYRLEHIKLMLKQKRTVYGSDRVYLDHLIDEYVEQIKTQKQLSKIRDDVPFEETPETITSEEDVEGDSDEYEKKELVELEHIYCWKCGKSIPVNSKFCFDCGSDIKNPKVKEEPLEETLQETTTETTKEKSNTGNKKNILLVVGVLVILAVVGGAVVMEGTFDKTISSIGDNKSLPTQNTLTVESDSTSKCGPGTVFDDTTNSCVLEGTQTTSKCGPGTVFDDTTNSCVLEGTQTTSKCGPGTVFDDTTNSCVLEGT